MLARLVNLPKEADLIPNPPQLDLAMALRQPIQWVHLHLWQQPHAISMISSPCISYSLQMVSANSWVGDVTHSRTFELVSKKRSDEVKSDQIRSVSGQVRSGQIRSDQISSKGLAIRSFRFLCTQTLVTAWPPSGR